jgi:adenine-specific DNA-methyltransferase
LVVQRIRNPKLKIRLVATFIDPTEKYYNNSGLTNVIMVDKEYSIKYVLAVLNSKLMNWYYRQFFRDVNIKPEDLRELPIKEISNTEQKQIEILVDLMLSLNNKLVEVGDKMTDARIKLEEEISQTDLEIDSAIYRIYRIDDSERKIIESSLQRNTV